MITRHALLVLILGAVLLVAMARACAHPAQGDDGGRTAYVPWVAPPRAPTPCDYRRDVWPCWVATMTAAAAGTPVPTSTRGTSATWEPAYPEPREPLRLPVMASVTGPSRICSAAWAPNGAWYLPAHCAIYNPLLLRINGAVVTAWQADTDGRDVAQAVAGDGGAAPVLARLAPGDAVVMRPARGDVVGTYAGDAWGVLAGGLYEVTTFERAGAWLVGAVCAGAGGPIVIGDSGGGVYRAADGALGAIVVAAEAYPAESDVWCGAGQVVTVAVLP